MDFMERVSGHFKTVCRHKYYVFVNCCKAGMPIRGVFHDLSKFTATEFFESVIYYQGTRSPINACKEKNGYSEAWMHHKGRNKHHYEYWQDNFDHGGVPLQVPFIYALELVCDYLAAGMAYNGDAFTYEGEYAWWQAKISKPIAMHPQTKVFVELMLHHMMLNNSNCILAKKKAKKLYVQAENMINLREKNGGK